MIHEVYLHGQLGSIYGNTPIKLSADSLKEIIKGLSANFGRKFSNMIRSGSYQITKGKRKVNADYPLERDKFILTNEIDLNVEETEIHIFPVLAGAGRFGQIILGVVLIIVAVVLAFTGVGAWASGILGVEAGTLISGFVVAGVLNIVGGLITLLMTPTDTGDYGKAEVSQSPSFLYNGVINVVEQGGPIPVCCGRHRTGSTVISANFTLDQIPYNEEIEQNLANDPGDFVNLNSNWVGVGADVVIDTDYLTITNTSINGYAELDITGVLTSTKYNKRAFIKTDGQCNVDYTLEDGTGVLHTANAAKTDFLWLNDLITTPSSFTGTPYLRFRVNGPIGSSVICKGINLTKSLLN